MHFPFPYNILTPPPLPSVLAAATDYQETMAYHRLLGMQLRLDDMMAKIDLFVLNRAHSPD